MEYILRFYIQRILKIIAAVLLLAVYLLILSWALFSPPDRDDGIAPVRISATEKRWIEQRHKYHGIAGSIEDGATGEKYFIRDGQRCKL